MTLELGGKSPTIILDDADLDQAIPIAVQAAFMNSGQACIAGTRLLAPCSRLAEIEHRLGTEEGARLLIGGEGRPAGLSGWFVPPTLFGGVTNTMTIAREEIFGPVLSLIAYEDEDDAVRIANDTVYGLHAYVLSGDQARADGAWA